jgi:hypothetical protein
VKRPLGAHIRNMVPAVLALLLYAAPPIAVRWAIGTLHGFPSMSDTSGRIIADGELRQEVSGRRVTVHVRWTFADGRRADEHDVFRTGAAFEQERFSWVDTRVDHEERRFEVDFASGKASSWTRDRDGRVERQEERLDLARGRAFAGYGVALAAAQLALAPGSDAEITFVAFTPKPRAVPLDVRRERGEEPIAVAGRAIACDRYTLHPGIPVLLRPFVHAPDAHLWLTHASPPALVRAEQALAAKDDPQVVIDVTPRGASRRAPEVRARRGR